MTLRSNAVGRLMAIAGHVACGERRCTDPLCVDCADRRTSMADARAAICLAVGTDPDEIDPASGYDHSARAYRHVRHSWVTNFTDGTLTEDMAAAMQAARANWARIRPVEADGDDWLAVTSDAHRAYWAGVGRPCNNSEDCIVCHHPAKG